MGNTKEEHVKWCGKTALVRGEKVIRLREKEFAEIVEYMRIKYGINLAKKKVLIECRMTKELQRQGVTSFETYMEMLRKDKTGKLSAELVNRLTTNYTYFMREPMHFSLLEQYIFRDLFESRNYRTCNIWCAGCSTGEEIYTLVMALEEYREKGDGRPPVRILATDISQEALEQARAGKYSIKALDGIPPSWQKRYCRIKDGKFFEIEKRLRNQIRFQIHNLMEESPGKEKFDLILCRNVMIYFDRSSRTKLVRTLEDSLNQGGYLFLGHAELLSREETCLEAVYPAVYRKNTDRE